MSPFSAVVPGRTQRLGPVSANNKMVKHKNKWWEIKTIKTRKHFSESGQDYLHSTGKPGDKWINYL